MNRLKEATDKARKVPPGLMFYYDDLDSLREITGDDFKALVYAVADHVRMGTHERLPPLLEALFNTLAYKADRDAEKHRQQSEKQRERVNKRWHPPSIS